MDTINSESSSATVSLNEVEVEVVLRLQTVITGVIQDISCLTSLRFDFKFKFSQISDVYIPDPYHMVGNFRGSVRR